MQIGISVRNMGVQSTPAIMADITKNAESAGAESVWVTDHIAIPPDDAEGSGGRYVDPLATLAWLAGQTTTIKLGTGVLILPYRPPLPTAKWIAAVQELSGGRLLLGVGIGWMAAEFKAVGQPLAKRGEQSDHILAFINECFADDEVTSNGQPMLFKPRPERPPIYIGGSAPHATQRAIKYGDGWMPIGPLPKLTTAIADYRSAAAKAGTSAEVIVFDRLDDREPTEMHDRLAQAREAGVSRVILTRRYGTARDWETSWPVIQQLTSE